MLLDYLTVRAFRGIRKEIPLDLRARLTLIQAPNGIGKTSLCDAVEWLFTGEVLRLKESVGRTKGKGIQNIFEQLAPPFAEAVVSNGSDTFRVRREGLSNPHKIQVSFGLRWQTESLSTVLGRITPQNLPRSARGLQEFISRRNWFRAARFLDTDGLHLLLDSDNESNEVRDLVFSDLLGVGELQRRERDLRKIIGFLGGKTRLAKQISEAEKEVRLTEGRLEEATRKASATLLETFRKQMDQLTEELELKPRSNRTPEGELATVEEALVSREAEVRLKQKALAYVRKRKDTISDVSAEISNLEKRRKNAKAKLDQLQEPIRRLERAVREIDEEWSKLRAISEALLALPFEEVKGRLEAAVSEWQVLGGQLDKSLDVNSLASSLAEARKNVATEKELLLVTSQCESSLKIWHDQLAALRLLAAQVSPYSPGLFVR